MLALHHTPKAVAKSLVQSHQSKALGHETQDLRLWTRDWELVRQARLELAFPCLRGRCLDPFGLLTRVGQTV
jgi:hypothetical protein